MKYKSILISIAIAIAASPVIAGVGGYIVNTYNSTTKETRYPNGAVAGAICWSIVTEPGNDYCARSVFSKPEVQCTCTTNSYPATKYYGFTVVTSLPYVNPITFRCNLYKDEPYEAGRPEEVESTRISCDLIMP